MIREFLVRPVLNGFIVSIGCQTLVFTNRKEMLSLMDSYLQYPDSVEKEMLENSSNAKHLRSPALTEYPVPPVSVYGHTMPCNPSPPEGSIGLNPVPLESCRDQQADCGPSRY